MAITAQMRTEVSQLYVALFGRAPDGDGLGFWVQLRDQGQSLTQIANTMYATTPARAYFPSFLTNSEIINSFYVNVLGRAPDADGLAFWTAQLNAPGATPGSVISTMINVVANYTGTDAAGKTSAALFNNKVSVAQFYGESNGTVAGATTVLAGVTSDPATVTTAKAAITSGAVTGVNQGLNLVLTTGVDTITGSNGNDTITADQTGTNPQLTAADTINGGSGTDLLRYFAKAADTTITLGTLSSIEKLYVNGGSIATMNLGTVAGLTDIEIDAQTTNMTGTGLNVVGTQSVKFSNNNGTTVYNEIVTYGATDAAGNITVNGVGKAGSAAAFDVQGAALATLNLTATGTASVLNLTNSAGTKLATLNISGDKNVTITEALAGLKTINASTATGNVSVDQSGLGTDNQTTFTGGAGNDTIIFKATYLTAGTTGDVLDGGAGTDTIVINDTAPVYAALNAAKNFEVLGLGTTGATVDIGSITSGINQFVQRDGVAAATFTNALSTSKFTVDVTSGTTSLSIGNKVGETATTVTVDNQSAAAKTLGTLTTAGATTVALASTGKAGSATTITTFANAENSNITLTGSTDLTITNALAGTTTGSKFDASAFTGKLTITGSAKTDILIGGSAADTLTTNGGADVLTGNGGVDTFKVTASVYGAGGDIVNITDIASKESIVLANQGTETFTATKVDVTAATTLTAALNLAAAGNGGTNGIVTWFQFGGNTYVVEDLTAGNTIAATDIVVKLTGTVDLSTATYTAGTDTLTLA